MVCGAAGGRAGDASQTDYLFTGQEYDSITYLYNLRARYYSPTSGRFLSQDTWAIDYNTPVEYNRYAYAANNPATLRDPSGHLSIETGLLNRNAFIIAAAVAVTYYTGSIAIEYADDLLLTILRFPSSIELALTNAGNNLSNIFSGIQGMVRPLVRAVPVTRVVPRRRAEDPDRCSPLAFLEQWATYLPSGDQIANPTELSAQFEQASARGVGTAGSFYGDIGARNIPAGTSSINADGATHINCWLIESKHYGSKRSPYSTRAWVDRDWLVESSVRNELRRYRAAITIQSAFINGIPLNARFRGLVIATNTDKVENHLFFYTELIRAGFIPFSNAVVTTYPFP